MTPEEIPAELKSILAHGPERARIEELERRLDKLTCQCCVFGNHTELCTCDGEGCCHPDQYAEYLPVRRHGNWGEA